jgi:fused signal recognition particle receptor
MSFWKKLVEKFVPVAGEPVDWEALLIEADLGLTLTERYVTALAQQGLLLKPNQAQIWLQRALTELLSTPAAPPVFDQPEVILLVGVNGSGKTTTAAKLTHRAQKNGRTVLLGAADTFRAAAVDQLQTWGERLQVPVVTGAAESDPASVAYRAHQQALEGRYDLLIVDSAGRLPNKHNLMQEIAKIKRTLGKLQTASPHHVWLVVDATTGSNILAQAREFHATVGLTGLIMTKLDSQAKGGMVAAVKAEIGLPTLYLGRGEQLEDLQPFRATEFVEEFFGT